MFQNRLRKLDSKFISDAAGTAASTSTSLRGLLYSWPLLLIHLTCSRCGFGEALSPFPVFLTHHHRLGVYYHVVLRLDV